MAGGPTMLSSLVWRGPGSSLVELANAALSLVVAGRGAAGRIETPAGHRNEAQLSHGDRAL